MPDIVINPSLGKIDFFTTKGDQVTNSIKLVDASTILFTGAVSASAISNGSGSFVTAVQPTSNYLNKFTGNASIANSLIYDNGTNIGIGTTSPIFKFQVVGSAYVNNGTLYIDSGNSLTWGNSTQSILGTDDVGLSFTAGSANRMFISSSGNIGIGTTTTAARLHVNSTTSGVTLLRTDGTNGTLFSVVDDLSDSLMSVNNSAGLPVLEVFADDRIIGGQYGQNDFAVVNNKVGIGTNNPIAKLHVSSSSSTPSAAFLGGNVGIGTTSPIYQLDIPSTASLTRIGSALIGSWPVGNSLGLFGNSALDHTNGGNYALLQSNNGITYLNAASGQSVRLRINNNDALIVDSNSNVGIGTTSPVDKLHVIGNIRINGGDILNWGGQAFIQTIGANDMFFRPNSTLQMILQADGNLGIGSSFTTPSAKLHVSGSSTSLSAIFNGCVGIGTSSPNSTLQIAGTSTGILTVGTLTNNWGGVVAIGTTNGNGIILSKVNTSNDTNRVLVLMRDDTNGAKIEGYTSGGTATDVGFLIRAAASSYFNGGSVGIGTNNPGSRLEVQFPTNPATDNGAGNNVLRVWTSASYAADVGGAIGLGGTYNTSSYQSFGQIAGRKTNSTVGNNAGYLQFATTNASGTMTEWMRIDAGGNVGIGTTVASARLHISSSSNDGLAQFKIEGVNAPSTFNWASTFINSALSSSRNYISLIGQALSARNSGYIGFNHSGTAGSTSNFLTFGLYAVDNILNINGSGYVGIGTTSPTTLLQLRQTTATHQIFSINRANSAIPAIYIGNDSSDNAIIASNNTVLRFGKDYTGTFNEYARIDTSGNLGIGTTSPSAKLQVVGTANVIELTQATTGSATYYVMDNTVETGGRRYRFGYSGASADKGSFTIYNATDNITPFTILTSGSIGIGTTSPSNKTTIEADGTGVSFADNGVGQLVIRGSTNTAKRLGLGIDTTNNIGVIQAQLYGTGQYPLVLNPAGGNVGIGTNSPSAKLHVVDADNVLLLQGNQTSGTRYNKLRFANQPGTIQEEIYGGYYGVGGLYLADYTNNGILFGVSNASGTFTERVRIDSNGNVGIGTTSINAKLAVEGGSIATVNITGSDVKYSFDIRTLVGGAIGFNNAAASNVYGAVTGSAYFGVAQAYPIVFTTNGTERLRITSGGNVIIGNNTPYGGLTISDLSANDGNDTLAFFYRGTSGNHESLVKFYDFRGQLNASLGNSLQDDGSGIQKADLVFKTSFNANPTERMRITNIGNVGIGSSSPAYKLDVAGSVYSSNYFSILTAATYGTSDNSAAIQVFGSTGSGGLTNTIKFLTAGSERIRIASDGNVGIGTSSPTVPFDVAGSALIELYSANVQTGGGIYFRRGFISGSYNLSLLAYDHSSGGTSPDGISINAYDGVSICTGANTRQERMRVDINGNVGIGTTSPISKLNTYGSGSNLSVFRADGGNGTLFEVTDNLSGSLFSVNTIAGLPVMEVFSDNKIVAGPYNTNTFVITGSSIGIGTSIPTQKLHLNSGVLRISRGGNDSTGEINIDNGTEYSGNSFQIRKDSSAYWALKSVTSGNDLAVFVDNNVNLGLYIKNASGNVGIGTSTVATKLVVSNGSGENIEFNPGNATYNGGILEYINRSSATTRPDFNFFLNSAGGGAFKFYTGGANERMRITSDGNVGIGTSIPTGLLEVTKASSGAVGPILFLKNNVGLANNNAVQISFASNSGGFATTPTAKIVVTETSAALATMTFHTYNGVSTTEKMTITSGGNVGIGTTAPSASLHVNSTTAGATLLRTDGTNGTLFSVVDDLSDSLMSVNNSAGLPVLEVFADDRIVAGQYGQNDLVVRNNNVGIGTNNPIAKLHVSGSTTSLSAIFNGNVGIGTTSPVGRLDIRGGIEYLNTSGSTSTSTSGSLMILGQNTRGGSTYHDFLFVSHTSASATNPQKSFRLNNTGAIEIINSAYTTTIFSLTDAGVLSTPGGGTSDIRTKQNVEYIYEDVSTTINKLKPVKFEFKDNPNVKRHGFIAQDVLPIKPDLVLGDGDKPNGTYGLDYDGILALTVKALQESNIKIKELENRISQLENKS